MSQTQLMMAKAACHPIYIHTLKSCSPTSLYSQNMLHIGRCADLRLERLDARERVAAWMQASSSGLEGQVLGVYLQSARKGGQLHPGRTVLTTEGKVWAGGPSPETHSQLRAFQSATAAFLQAPGTHPNQPSESGHFSGLCGSSSLGSQPEKLAGHYGEAQPLSSKL